MTRTRIDAVPDGVSTVRARLAAWWQHQRKLGAGRLTTELRSGRLEQPRL